MARVWAVLAIVVCAFAPALAAESDILHCTSIKEDAARLKCFDGEADKLVTARLEAEKNAVGFFGFLSRQFQFAPEGEAKSVATAEQPGPRLVSLPPRIQELTAKVAWVGEDSAGKTMIRFDNEQVWANLESGAIAGAKVGAQATIRESAFNGFRLKIDGRSGEYRVRRVD